MREDNLFNDTIKKVGETGYVLETKYPIAVCNGLPGARLNELILFETGDLGNAFSLEADAVQIGNLGKRKIPVGTRVTRVGKRVMFNFHSANAGKIVDPLGNIISGESTNNDPEAELDMFIDIPPLVARRNVVDQLITGVSVVDMLLPIGQGQRELLVGDRKTGKRQVALQACKSAIEHGMKVVYVAAGQNNSDIHVAWDFFKKNKVDTQVHIVATSPLDSPCMIYMAPFAGMAIAEYFAQQKAHTLLIIEDLTTHAQFYREFSLVAGRFPGRESYPGDIFYTHAHLLERAGNFEFEKGTQVSITCLPMIHTPEGEISSYIATNSIGITDGHLFFDKERYLKGILPPIHIGLSVTRAGKQTQTSLLRDINRKVTTFISEFESTKSFSSFGSDMTEEVQNLLNKGECITTFFRQSGSETHSLVSDLIILGLIWNDLFSENKSDTFKAMRDSIDQNIASQGGDFQKNIVSMKSFDELSKFITENKDMILQLCGKNK